MSSIGTVFPRLNKGLEHLGKLERGLEVAFLLRSNGLLHLGELEALVLHSFSFAMTKLALRRGEVVLSSTTSIFLSFNPFFA